MFKELKVLKIAILLLVVVLVVTLNDSNNDSKNIVQTVDPSVVFGEKIFVQVKFYDEDFPIIVKNSSGNVVADYQVSGKAGAIQLLSESILNGFHYDTVLCIEEKLKPGFYTVNDIFPLVVKPPESKEIAVIFPYLNNLLYSTVNDSIFIANVIDKFHSNNPSYVNDLDKNIMSLLNEEKFEYSVYSDVDLNILQGWNKSKLLIIYGKTKFYTQEMLDNLWEFNRNGGHILFISTENSKYKLSKSNDVYSFEIQNQRDWKHLSNLLPFTDNSGWLVNADQMQLNNELFQDQKSIEVTSSYWSGMDDILKSNFYESKIVGDISMMNLSNKKVKDNTIGFVQVDSLSGKLFNMGTEVWLENSNFSRQKTKIFLRNCIDYLLKN